MADQQERAQKPRYGSIVDFLAGEKKPWEYDFKFQYENFDADRYWNLNEDDSKPLVRLLKYKKELKEGDRFIKNNAFDCDGTGEIEEYVCKLTREIYRTLWDWQDKYSLPEKAIKRGKTKIKRYAHTGFDPLLSFGPDTMSSFFTAFEHYLKIALHRNMDQAALYAEMVAGGRDIPFEDERIEKLWISYAERHHSIRLGEVVPACRYSFFAGPLCSPPFCHYSTISAQICLLMFCINKSAQICSICLYTQIYFYSILRT